MCVWWVVCMITLKLHLWHWTFNFIWLPPGMKSYSWNTVIFNEVCNWTVRLKLASYEHIRTQDHQDIQHLHPIQEHEAIIPMGIGLEEAQPSCLGIFYQRLHSGPLWTDFSSPQWFLTNTKQEVQIYRTIALISHTSKIMFKILQARIQQYVNCELPDVQAGFRKGRGTRDQIANICWIAEKAENSRKASTSALLTMSKPVTI